MSLTRQQKSIVFGSWLGWSLDGYDLVLMLLALDKTSGSANNFFEKLVFVSPPLPALRIITLFLPEIKERRNFLSDMNDLLCK